ncbi:sensor domain-containing phosphodiesterase [Colwellia ponticola]|uniref:EAL domain-containing protein n=1 Tax=Colwellia ponticola TaxID=2304625 RepID=A0A8H2JJE9_9GAMM|nr:EAL domain-containing protein [Colwellia ponticola]TMM42003.1 EAL domain-containing protein [Colwellia ponticola]
MKSDDLQSLILNKNNSGNVNSQLKNILSIIRKHLNMEVAFISEFIDGERVFRFIDAKHEVPPINVGESDPLEQTYCQRIVDNTLPNIIQNTNNDNITKTLSVTNKLSIGSYMGVPIRLSTGKTYGTFCCYKKSPDDTLNKRDLSFLSVIADIVSDLIEQHIDVEDAHKAIEQRTLLMLEPNKIEIHYQPVYSLITNQVTGFESLSRFVSTPYITPDVWFNEASQVGLGEELEMMAINNAIKGMGDFQKDLYISINTSPEYILSGAVAKILSGIDTRRIVLEITEHSPISSYADFREALKPLREQGVRLAIDDAGAGYSSFKHILELEADIIKLDISLTQNIHRDRKKFLLAKALCGFAKAIDCIIIAEGIETAEELNALKELNVDKVQGYLLGRPMPIEQAISHVQNILV